MQSRNQSATIDYITRTFVREPAWLAPVRAEGERRRPGMQISPYEGHLLHWLVKMSAAKNILEIGTFVGYSTLWMAKALPADGRITSLEFDTTHAKIAAAHVAASPHASRIEVQHSDAHVWLANQPLIPTYDLVFIDAEKSGYADYLEAIIPRLNPRGWIIGDNTLLFGAMSGEDPNAASAAAKKSMTKFNETLADATRFESVLLPTTEGLTIARLR